MKIFDIRVVLLSLPDFKVVQLGRRAPPLIDLDSPVWHVRADRRDLYFMPDHVMIYDGANIGGVSYSKLELRSALETTQARTVAKQTRDSKVVGTTYRFVNNDGTPDQRFNNNVPIPLLEYGVFCLSGSGLDMRLFASNQNAGVAASRGFEAMQRLAAKPVVTAAETRRREATVKVLLEPFDAGIAKVGFYHTDDGVVVEFKEYYNESK